MDPEYPDPRQNAYDQYMPPLSMERGQIQSFLRANKEGVIIASNWGRGKNSIIFFCLQ